MGKFDVLYAPVLSNNEKLRLQEAVVLKYQNGVIPWKYFVIRAVHFLQQILKDDKKRLMKLVLSVLQHYQTVTLRYELKVPSIRLNESYKMVKYQFKNLLSDWAYSKQVFGEFFEMILAIGPINT